MALKVTRVDTWVARIKDKPGGLAKRLAALSASGANLEFVIARRMPERKGGAVVFVTPIRPGKQSRAARKAGFAKATNLHAVRVEGADRKGQGARIAKTLAAAGLNLRGLSGAAIGKTFVSHLALDTSADARKAVRILKAL